MRCLGVFTAFGLLTLAGLCAALASCAAHHAGTPAAGSNARAADTIHAPPTSVHAVVEPVEPVQPLALDGYARSSRDRYNRIYADPSLFMNEPNAFLLTCLDRIDDARLRDGGTTAANAQPRLAALDIAMGEGRNTIALAQRGYEACGFDMSDVGVNRARQRAADLGLTIDARLCYFRDFDFGEARWDVVVMMYFSVDDNNMKRIQRSVKPGGCIIIERAGGDIYNDFLRQFGDGDWEVIAYEQAWGPRDWSSGQGNATAGVRTQFFAKKRLPAADSKSG